MLNAQRTDVIGNHRLEIGPLIGPRALIARIRTERPNKEKLKNYRFVLMVEV
jgi:hypothetical protein